MKRSGRCADGNWRILRFGQLAGEKFDLVLHWGFPIDQNEILTIDAAAAAMDAITRFAQQFFLAYVNVHRVGPDDQILETSFLTIFSLRHGFAFETEYRALTVFCKPSGGHSSCNKAAPCYRNL